jgi:hypothetical protein
MKKLLLILLCVPLIGLGQTRERPVNSFVVSATEMNILYANDIENPIRVSVSGYSADNIHVAVNGGTIIVVNKKKGEYIIKTSQDNIGKKVTVSVAVRENDGKRRLIGKSVFNVSNLPETTLSARYIDGIHSKNAIMANTFSSKIKDFNFPIKLFVSEFTVVCIGKKRVETKVKGYKLSEAAKIEINKLDKGHTVLFKDFVVRQIGVSSYIDKPLDKFELIIE